VLQEVVRRLGSEGGGLAESDEHAAALDLLPDEAGVYSFASRRLSAKSFELLEKMIGEAVEEIEDEDARELASRFDRLEPLFQKLGTGVSWSAVDDQGICFTGITLYSPEQDR
jgi:hypothetical protein